MKPEKTSTEKNKPKLSFWQIWNMSFGFLGIQVGWGLQMGNMSAIYEYLGAEANELPLLWLAAPLTGLLVQPIIGFFSDLTWSERFGRRKPYFLVGAILASIALLIMPHSTSIWMAAGLLWMLDASINISMEPTRAFVADVLPKEQYTKGYAMQSFFIGLGAVLAALIPLFLTGVVGLPKMDVDGGIPLFVKLSFSIGSIFLLAAILVPVLTTKEYPPEILHGEKTKDRESFSNFLASYLSAFKKVPSSFLRLAPTQFFTWIGLFLMWFYLTPAIATNIFGGKAGDALYGEGLIWGNICFGFYSFITFLCALVLPKLESKIGKINLHFLCLIIGGIALISILGIQNKFFLLLSMTGVGIAWASIVATPYSIIAQDIPASQMGLYMGLFNFFIVVPEILATLFFGRIMESFLQNNRLYAIALGGAMLLIAALLLKIFFRQTRY